LGKILCVNNKRLELIKTLLLTLITFFNVSAFAQNSAFKVKAFSVYCVGPALCEMAKQIVKHDEEHSFKYTEFPLSINKKLIKELPHPDIFLSYPIELTSGWSDYFNSIYWKKSSSVFTVGREATLKILYPRKKSRLIAPVVDEVDDAVYFPFFFYPKAINFVYESLYGFLSKVVPVKENALHGIFLKEHMTYDLEACLGKISQKHKVEFLFPTERLSVFFSHIGITNSVISKVNEKTLKETSFKDSKHLIFFNLSGNEKRIVKEHPNLKSKKVTFWDIPYEREQFSVNPGVFLNKVFSSAVEATGFSNECQLSSE